eukprot:4999269-Amphidinium_carterae.1
MAHHVCGNKLPEDLALVANLAQYIGQFNLPKDCHFNGRHYPRGGRCVTAEWNHLCGADKFILFQDGHQPLWQPQGAHSYGAAFGTESNISDMYLSNVVTMVRAPAQRAISGWYMQTTECRAARTLPVYQICVSACHTQMILGVMCGTYHKGGFHELLGMQPAEAVELAVARMK